MDHNCPCSEGDVRLSGGNVRHQGRVEFCTHARWSTLCDWRWTTREASVVCHQLGYPTARGNHSLQFYTNNFLVCFTGEVRTFGRFGERPSTQIQEFDVFVCSGDELQLSDCDRGRSFSCNRDNEVICSKCIFDEENLHNQFIVTL